MGIGQFSEALQQVMVRRGETLATAGRAAHVDGSQIGKILKGTRKASETVMKAAVRHYDDIQLIIGAGEEVMGGACVPYLDGADLHPSSTHIKTIEEVQEALQALLQLPITKRLDQLGPGDLENIKDGIMEQLEAITALTHNAAVLCRKYDLSYISMWNDHRAELKLKKYMK
ncbi:XRE family transcriptional regulator [Paenibacillus sp. 19GGS1-52]|nr:XRE family transcriptional regulator [Paenibacillus sp. 19GGS1-52]